MGQKSHFSELLTSFTLQDKLVTNRLLLSYASEPLTIRIFCTYNVYVYIYIVYSVAHPRKWTTGTNSNPLPGAFNFHGIDKSITLQIQIPGTCIKYSRILYVDSPVITRKKEREGAINYFQQSNTIIFLSAPLPGRPSLFLI